MTDVVHIDGAPGVGKTYTLRQKLEAEVDGGVELNDFYWLNFTNSGRRDVEPEIAEVFDGTDTEQFHDEPADRAFTFHGLTMRLAIRTNLINGGDEPEQVIEQGQYLNDDDLDEFDPHADFCERNNMRYDPKAADPKKLLSGEKSTDNAGNKLFAISDYLTQTCKPAEKWKHAGVRTSTADGRVPELLEKWDEYKKNPPVEGVDRRLFEHGDYVDMAYHAGLVPDADVLLIDEFQDLAPVEYRLYKSWRDYGPVERLYIAGDENQSIYSFRGGTPVYFEGTPTDQDIQLKKSYRCPENIAAVGNSVLSAHPELDARGFEGIDGGGTVGRMADPTEHELRDSLIEATDRYDRDDGPSVMMLTRTNAQLYRVTKLLRSIGVPFEELGTGGSVWDGELGEIIQFLHNFENDGGVYLKSRVMTVLESLPATDEMQRAMGGGFGQLAFNESVERAFEPYDSVGEVIDDLNRRGWEKDALYNAVEAPASIGSGEVHVGTLHTAKGLEAPAVYLFTDTTDSMDERYRDSEKSAKEEHRAYYVGTTRASEELRLVDDYFNGPMAPPLRGASLELSRVVE